MKGAQLPVRWMVRQLLFCMAIQLRVDPLVVYSMSYQIASGKTDLHRLGWGSTGGRLLHGMEPPLAQQGWFCPAAPTGASSHLKATTYLGHKASGAPSQNRTYFRSFWPARTASFQTLISLVSTHSTTIDVVE